MSPTQLISFAIGNIVSFDTWQIQPVPQVAQGLPVSFLSGLVTIDKAMLALIDLQNLLTAAAAEIKDSVAARH